MFRALPLVMDFDLGRGSEFFRLEIGGSCYYGGFRGWVMGGGLTSIGLKEGDHEQRDQLWFSSFNIFPLRSPLCLNMH